MPRALWLVALVVLLTVVGAPASARAADAAWAPDAGQRQGNPSAVGWRSEVGVGLPHLVATAHGVTFGPGFAVGPFAALTLPAAPATGVAPVIGGAVDARLRDWQLVHLEVRLIAAATWPSATAVPRFGVTAALVRSDAGVRTRFGVGALFDDPGGAATLLPMVTLAWRFGVR